MIKIVLPETVAKKPRRLTTDEWTNLYSHFRNNVDSAIQHLTTLTGKDAYRLRRMIMIYARQEFDN